MRQVSICIFAALFAIAGSASFSRGASAQHGAVRVDWKAELEKARAKIAENPRSAFWHNQAGVAYDALGDFKSAVKELELASKLEPNNSMHEYVLYAMYKHKGMVVQEKQALLRAIERDPENPFGHSELGYLLEKEEKWSDSLKHYKCTEQLLTKVPRGKEYRDPIGNPFSVDYIREHIAEAIQRARRHAQ
jgi:tetratricopeptide (TPR) repeat protein